MNITIRPFHYTDLDQVIRLMNESFADDFTAQGMTPAGFAAQARMLTRGRMIPLRLLARMMGIRWGAFVAADGAHIVGFATYFGRDQAAILGNLVVSPEYRRQGIGRRLLQRRLEGIAAHGFPYATVTTLATNDASLGNVRGQGFTELNRYGVFELPVPAPQLVPLPAGTAVRPLLDTDKATLSALEAQTIDPEVVRQNGTAVDRYFPSFADRLYARFTGDSHYARAFVREETAVGFVAVSTTSGRQKGTLARPILDPESISCWPGMLGTAVSWLLSQGKTALQVSLPDERTELIAGVRQTGGVRQQSWVQLVKKLSNEE